MPFLPSFRSPSSPFPVAFFGERRVLSPSHMQAAVHRPRAPGMPRGCRGQSLVEMAVAFPLLLLLVAGALDLAHAYSVSSIVANAVREGARYGATQPND